jgi:hypothetical protein
VRKNTDKVFDRLTEDAQKREEALTFEEVYIAVLCVYKYQPIQSSRSSASTSTMQFFFLFVIGFVLVGQ